MVRASVIEPVDSIFEANTRPQLFYLQREGGEKKQTAHTLQSQVETAEIIVIEEGCGRYMVDNQVYDITKENIILLNAGVLHGLCPEIQTPFTTRRLGIRNLHLKGLPWGHFIGEDISPVLKTESHFAAIKQFFNLFDALQENKQKQLTNEAKDNLLAALLAAIMPLIHSTVPNSTRMQEYNLGLHIKEYIDEHYLEDLRLNDIASALHINPYYLSHTFKKAVGYSPIQYMIRRRIGESQNLLVNTSYTITDIALRCGYNNSNYFQAVFNSIVGMPPGRYRKAWRQ